jgi:hypothetical protein
MNFVRVATRAVFTEFQAIWMFPFVFGQRVVTRTTIRASQCNVNPHTDTSSILITERVNDYRKYPNYIITPIPILSM